MNEGMGHGVAGKRGVVYRARVIETLACCGKGYDIMGRVDAGVAPQACYSGTKPTVGFWWGIGWLRKGRDRRGRVSRDWKEGFATAFDEATE